MTKISSFMQVHPDAATREAQSGKSDMSSQHENWIRQMELSMMKDANLHGSFNATAIQTQKSTFKSAIPSLDNLPESATSREKQATAKRSVYPVSPVARKVASVENHVISTDNIAAVAQTVSDSANAPELSQTRAAGEQQAQLEKQSAGMEAIAPDVKANASAGSTLPFTSDVIFTQKITGEVSVNKNSSMEISQPLTASPRAAGLSRNTLPGQTQDQNEVHAESQEPADEAKAAVREQELDKQIWQKRMMHITTEDQNVNVWIRDQEINTEQTPQLIRQLTREMTESGLRLNGATINGKLVFKYKNTDGDSEVRIFQGDEAVVKSDEASARNVPFSYVKKGR
ncbi:hypothetical protein UNDYM_5988 (plasmid) [Undibacterium sp. YM2]|uniref:hypothetical protein n=1 Tax=Undibacterium sp. YM2 TaxID=2058625 RepID=UPI001331D7FA|nr:hypothetical protein [Undibacterium sp. YM2]BBB70241.1 hypothetical protein UNDYM_5988 [Undibacterium sp. YM2]